VTKGQNEHLDELRAASWDMRASMEANARAMTALQRCIDDYRRTADPQALDEIVKHIAGIRGNLHRLRDGLADSGRLVDALKSTHRSDNAKRKRPAKRRRTDGHLRRQRLR